MRFILSILTTFSVALFVLAGCQTFASSTKLEKVYSNSTSAPKVDESARSEEAPRITLEDAKKDFDAGTAIFIDTRGDDVHKAGHIKGAISISESTLEARIKDIPKDKKIIVYCS